MVGAMGMGLAEQEKKVMATAPPQAIFRTSRTSVIMLDLKTIS